MKHTEEATRIAREKLQPMGNDAPLEFGKAYAALISTTEELLAAKEQVAKLEKVRAAAENIRHWHDSANDGMIVSAVAVRKLWEALDPRALDKKAGE